MLRIGQFTDTFLPVVDGVGRVVQAYAETLTSMGHQVTVVAPMPLLGTLMMRRTARSSRPLSMVLR